MTDQDTVRHNFQGHPEFTRLLERIAHEIDPGEPDPQAVRVTFAHGGQHSTFSLRAENFELTRRSEASRDLGCIVCGVKNRRQYGFYVHCDDGRLHGPIGSSCIFRHVLGIERAATWGDSLQTLARRLAALPIGPELAFDETVEDYDAYLRRLSLAYLLHGPVLRHARLTDEELEAFQRCRDAEQPLPAGLYATLRGKGDRMLKALTQQPLSREAPYPGHQDHPLWPRQPEPPVRFDPDVNLHPFNLSVIAGWMQTAAGHSVLRLRFTRRNLPYYRPVVIDLDSADEARKIGEFLSGLAPLVSALYRQTDRVNHLRHLGAVACGSFRLHAWYGARMDLPTGEHEIWTGTRVVLLDVFDTQAPQRQAIRLYESDNGTFDARFRPLTADGRAMMQLGTWLHDQSQHIGRAPARP